MIRNSLSVINSRLQIDFDPFSFFQCMNGAALFICLLFWARSVYCMPSRLERFSFIVGTLALAFYQFPLFLFSDYFESALPNFYFFSFTVHLVVIACLLWGRFSRCMSSVSNIKSNSRGGVREDFSAGLWIALLGSVAIFVSIYLFFLPFNCTGLFAMVFDPKMTLLAREFSIKLSGSRMAALSYGVLSNALIPVVAGLAYLHLRKNISSLSIAKFTYSIISIIICLFIILLPGIKGMLFPTFVMCIIVAFFSEKKFVFRLLNSGLFVVFMFGSISSVLYLKDHMFNIGDLKYDAGYCAVQAGKCTEAMGLVDSLYLRDRSLELSFNDRDRVARQIHVSCSKLKGYGRDRVAQQSNIASSRFKKQIHPHLFHVKLNKGLEQEAHKTYAPMRLVSRFSNAFYRAFVLPIQVASWHFLYASHHPDIGLDILPAANRFFGKSTNVAIDVYQKYGSVYSGGDKTSTSTAPTSFLLFYPAFLGMGGLLLALMLVFSMDLFSLFIYQRLIPELRLPFVGLLYIGGLNFMVSDFLTVLLSHGLGAGVVLLLLLNYLEKFTRLRRSF